MLCHEFPPAHLSHRLCCRAHQDSRSANSHTREHIGRSVPGERPAASRVGGIDGRAVMCEEACDLPEPFRQTGLVRPWEPDAMRGQMDCFGETDRGRVRPSNQDQFLIADLKKSVHIHHTSLSYEEETELYGGSLAKLLLVADGVGGHAGGERASTLALESTIQYLLNAMHWILRPDDAQEPAVLADLKSALSWTREQIQHAAELAPAQNRMGTTMTLAWVVWPSLYLAHVGDSRAYLLRNGELVRLTRDQTWAQALADAGVLNEREVAESPLNHVLSSLLGCDPEHFSPQTDKRQLQLNDTLLLCTDGLTHHLTDQEILELLTPQQDARTTCRALVEAANAAGGRDNTTVVVARFRDASASEESAVAEAAAEPSAAITEHSAPGNAAVR